MDWLFLLGGVGLLLLYLCFWPVYPKPMGSFKTDKAPARAGIYEPNLKLQAVERIGEGYCLSPESITMDSQGRIYAGMEDGRVMRFSSSGEDAELLIDTGGRPLGLTFDRHGNLIIADCVKGLLSVDPKGKLTILAREAGGREIAYANDLDISADGKIFFSDFQFYKGADSYADFVDGRPQTRLLMYDPETQSTSVLLDGLYGANGVSLGPGDLYVLVNEFFAYRVTRYWLSGTRKGQTDTFIQNLPGMPDNITFNGSDTFWIAIFQSRSPIFETLQASPFLRGVMKRLPSFLVNTKPQPFGWVLGVDLDGNVIHNFQDPLGRNVFQVTSAFEYQDWLYLGNIGDNAINRLRIEES